MNITVSKSSKVFMPRSISHNKDREIKTSQSAKATIKPLLPDIFLFCYALSFVCIPCSANLKTKFDQMLFFFIKNICLPVGNS
jgi:hypothetical protein